MINIKNSLYCMILIIPIFLLSCIHQKKTILSAKDENNIVYKKFLYVNNSSKKITYITKNNIKYDIEDGISVHAYPDIQIPINDFIEANLIYPVNYHKVGVVIVVVLIDKEGVLIEWRIIARNGVDNFINISIENIMKLLGNWKPAIKNNKAVVSFREIAIRFR